MMVIPGYTGGVKTAISLPADDFKRIEHAAQANDMSRSSFFRTAALRYADELEQAGLTAQINAYVERTGDDGTDNDWTNHSKSQLAAATEDDTW
jgi:hypothetical protein